MIICALSLLHLETVSDNIVCVSRAEAMDAPLELARRSVVLSSNRLRCFTSSCQTCAGTPPAAGRTASAMRETLSGRSNQTRMRRT
jgi:hypothetical protein